MPAIFVRDPTNEFAVVQDDELAINSTVEALRSAQAVTIYNKSQGIRHNLAHDLSKRQIDMICACSLINLVRNSNSEAY